jgi:hypothetical protein
MTGCMDDDITHGDEIPSDLEDLASMVDSMTPFDTSS